jgi:hypothetical protein
MGDQEVSDDQSMAEGLPAKPMATTRLRGVSAPQGSPGRIVQRLLVSWNTVRWSGATSKKGCLKGCPWRG